MLIYEIGWKKRPISMPPLHVEVRDDEIIVTKSDSKFRIVYHKAEDQPQLIAKGTPHGNYDFLAHAFISVLMFEPIVLCDEPFFRGMVTNPFFVAVRRELSRQLSLGLKVPSGPCNTSARREPNKVCVMNGI